MDRPFPLADGDEHFGRLASWGLTFVRLLVTWEAVEHAGPGRYDEAYLAYLVALVRRCSNSGICTCVSLCVYGKSRVEPVETGFGRTRGCLHKPPL